MNQKESNEVEYYLDQVSEHLGHLSDKEDILRELRAHIWDLAHELSDKKGYNFTDAFQEAINQMEDPATLATNFVSSESIPGSDSVFSSHKYVPERKITNEQYIIMALIGIISLLIISPIFSFSLSSGEFLPYIFGLSFIAGLSIIIFFLLFMYYQDEKTRNAQIVELRKRFRKLSSQIQDTKQKIPSSQLAKFFEHASGVFTLLWVIIATAAVFYLTFWLPFPDLFNNNWLFIGFFIVMISLAIEASTGILTIAFGKVRILRLLNGGRHLVLAALTLILLIYYPFNLSETILGQLPNDLDQQAIRIFENADFFAKIALGIIASIHWMAGLFDLFKYGFWKSSDTKSLTVE